MGAFVRNPPDDMTAQLRAEAQHCGPSTTAYLLWAADEIDHLRSLVRVLAAGSEVRSGAVPASRPAAPSLPTQEQP